MSKLQNLYEEITLRNPEDLAARALHLIASATGSLKRNLPAEELTTPEFLAQLKSGHTENIDEYIEQRKDAAGAFDHVQDNLITDDVINLAARAVDQTFDYPGGEFTFHGDIDWHHSLDNKASWPLAHWSEIPFRKLESLGDIKYTWDLNRHAFFPSMALAYLKTDDIKYIAALRRFIHTWCDQNTPETGIHYISNLEIGLRCISWHFTDRILKDSDVFDDGTRERMHKNIYSQTRHIAEYISYTEKTGRNNHLIGDAVALSFLSLQYPEWSESDKWLDKGLKTLWSTLDEQVLPDGMHFECSFGYHMFVTEFMLLLFSELRRLKKPVPAKCHMLLEKMVAVLQAAWMQNGELPNINDNDNGYVIPLPLSTGERICGILAVAAVLYDRPDFKSSSHSEFRLYSHLMLGEKGAAEYQLIATYPENFSQITHLKNSGLVIFQRGNDYALLKNNPDPFPRSGHNHADLLSILLTIDNNDILVDAGTYRYNADGGFRNALRSTFAHNTISIDLKPQAEPHRNFGWISHTEAGETHTNETPEWAVVDATHHSFARLGATHRRVLVWLKDQSIYIVIDRMSGSETHYFEQFWHFALETALEDKGDHRYELTRHGDVIGHISFFRENHNDRHEIMFGTSRNKSSYVSKKYGEIAPSSTLRHNWTSTLSQEHCSHRVTVFSKTPLNGGLTDISHGTFTVAGYTIDLSDSAVKITKA